MLDHLRRLNADAEPLGSFGAVIGATIGGPTRTSPSTARSSPRLRRPGRHRRRRTRIFGRPPSAQLLARGAASARTRAMRDACAATTTCGERPVLALRPLLAAAATRTLLRRGQSTRAAERDLGRGPDALLKASISATCDRRPRHPTMAQLVAVEARRPSTTPGSTATYDRDAARGLTDEQAASTRARSSQRHTCGSRTSTSRPDVCRPADLDGSRLGPDCCSVGLTRLSQHPLDPPSPSRRTSHVALPPLTPEQRQAALDRRPPPPDGSGPR